ncbi:bifunctional 2-polyprenyl-6-hydroxyphenol methylase/3-demethylubiquinol 3-O-methyltransferase UbiG [Mycolicibacterium sp. F2034L]|uniref:class I SAM-dependent methyltransferase n=1 Tax=Mycolicibacterium sp. F2034L TaxID=2926422 RepID=UPI001FF11C51|nr:class I SAM-dependent methyltransferase [Mycolicibacterium sp. F2034L]MCK0173437.1 class I SAM-dependent methyltransferase [Mycolicibacterium sp. F2034L]
MSVEFWEQHYGAKHRVWSGRVNPRLAEIAETLSPGTALDVGCGEGADAIWLARHGWRVVGVDVSETALNRAAEDAARAGVAERISFERHDLSVSLPDGQFDLASVQFLHCPYDWDRDAVLRRVAERVAPGGVFVLVDHGSAPSGMHEGHHHHFPSVHEVLEGLALDPERWERLRVEAVEREMTGPDGQVATISDNVIVLRRGRQSSAAPATGR